MKDVTSYKDLVALLKRSGYVYVRRAKHEIWKKDDDTISIPVKHGGRFSIYLARRILKEAKYVSF